MMKIQRLLTGLLLSFATTLFAQNASPPPSIDDYYIDFSVPNLTAFSLLDITSEEITRPGNLKDFAAAISNTIDTDGKIRPGLAIEFAPFLGGKDEIKTEEWFEKKVRWDRMAISLGTITQDSLGTRFALGLKFVPIDKSDPLGDPDFYNALSYKLDLFQSDREVRQKRAVEYQNWLISIGITGADLVATVNNTIDFNDSGMLNESRELISKGEIQNPIEYFVQKINKEINGQIDTTGVADEVLKFAELYTQIVSKPANDFGEYTKNLIKQEKEKYKKNNWNAMALQFSFGTVWNTVTGKYQDFKNQKLSGNASFGFPILNGKMKKNGKQVDRKIKGQGIIQMKIDNDNLSSTELSSRWSAAGRFLLGNANNRLSADIIYSDSDLVKSDGTKQALTFFQWSIGFEVKLTSGTWFEAAFGGQNFIEGDSGTAVIPSFGFKHAIQNKRKIELN